MQQDNIGPETADLPWARETQPAGPELRRYNRVIVVGIFLRFLLSAVALGTNDAVAWLRFGNEIRQRGLLKTYQTDPLFNHPPIPGYWAMIAAKFAGWGWPPLLFTNFFKLPVILADICAMYLLWCIWRKRVGPRAIIVPALFAMSLDAIFVSAFHCNTESIYVMLCLLAVYLIEERDASFWGGMALGAAVNVKLIPVLLIPVLLLNSRRWRDAAKILMGILPWLIPFLPPLLIVPHAFVQNVLRYSSSPDRWGVNFFLLLGKDDLPPQHTGSLDAWILFWKIAVLGLVVIWAVTAKWLRRWNRYEIAAVSFAIFLVFTPGFGIQYTALAGLLLFAVRPAIAFRYGVAAGAFAGAIYAVWWRAVRASGASEYGVGPRFLPIYVRWPGLFARLPAVLGLLPWAMLISFVLLTLVRPVSANRETVI